MDVEVRNARDLDQQFFQSPECRRFNARNYEVKMPVTQESTVSNAKPVKPFLTEDWTVVLLGLAIIILFLSGISIQSPVYTWQSPADLRALLTAEKQLTGIASMFILMYTVALVGTVILKGNMKAMALGFPVLFLISVVALLLSGNASMSRLNLEPVIFSLAIGLFTGNMFTLPDWLRRSLSTELFVKIGLVLLGTGIIFNDLLKAGLLGLGQALLVVVTVWYFAFWICKRLKLDEEMSLMISSAVSICGVSAAIATAGAIQGDTKKLSYVISLVLVTAIPMMILMPFIAEALALTPAVTGAWIGGTIDTTGAVVAAGSIAGEVALEISTIVKFSQNVLLGIAAFFISVYWAYRQRSGTSPRKERPSARLLWERFPKFVIGFMAASLLFSFLLDVDLVKEVKGGLKSLQNLWFVLAFTSIGLETRFRDLFHTDNKKPLYAFLMAQAFNILITLVIAYLLFRH